MSGRGQQVDMIAHQHVAMNGDVMRARGIAQAIEIESSVLCGGKHRRAIVAALHDVQDGTGVVEAWLAGHAVSVPQSAIARLIRKSSLTLHIHRWRAFFGRFPRSIALISPLAISRLTSAAPPTNTPFTNTIGKVGHPVHILRALRRRQGPK